MTAKINRTSYGPKYNVWAFINMQDMNIKVVRLYMFLYFVCFGLIVHLFLLVEKTGCHFL